ncbi:phospholipase D family protein [Halococcus sp. PRR34]|uniref:phospholipase D family protein n=1 Tax=Halococcus sp. PRR34 TaxID=3020830 RepID=UPI00235F8C6E|nr:phospholipase D family protein [Halococcus sp. PRR34]
MLNPHDRTLLHESLKPPAGYELDYALGTTYSLDLTALLAVPLAFTRHQQQNTDPAELDPVATLNALRRNSENMTIFCQTGRIQPPTQQNKLFQLLEDAVVETNAPSDRGAFHPKTWVLRYTAPDSQVHYRFLCLSRNLTYARSWDTVLRLDGEFRADRQLAYGRNHPLGDFVETLPDMAVRDLDTSRQTKIDTIQDELRRVEFSPPESFENIEFHPFGIDHREQWPFPDRETDIIVVSPFLSESLLERLAPETRNTTLISRWEELDTLRQTTLEPWNEVFALDTAAELNPESDSIEMPTEEAQSDEVDEEDALQSLHAKLVIVDDGWDARVYTGSANATRAAFEENVEFLVELQGKKSNCGTDVFLNDEENEIGIRDLLVPYHRDGPHETNTLAEQLDDALRDIRNAITALDLVASLEERPGDDSYRLRLEGADALDSVPHGASVQIRPITLEERAAEPFTINSPETATFDISYGAITSFIAFRATVDLSGESKSETFVLNVPLENTPTNREQRLLRSIINDRERFLRFLALLLGEADAGFGHLVSQADWQEWHSRHDSEVGNRFPLLEQLLRVLYENPEQLERIQELITDLGGNDDIEQVLPEGFQRVFDPISAVQRQEASGE